MTVTEQNRYWWLEDRIDTEERLARVLKQGLLAFLRDSKNSRRSPSIKFTRTTGDYADTHSKT